MKRLKQIKKKFFGVAKNQRGQGATEYILLLMVVVAIAFMFKGQIQTAVEAKLGELSGSIGSFTGGN
jgi:hypothetical protein